MQRILTGFAAGVMTAASVWSLLIPAIEQNEDSMGRLAFIPAAVGFLVGIFFLLLLDRLIPHLHFDSDKAEGLKAHLSKNTMLMLAVTLHNIPEGMAVGVVYAGLYYHSGDITAAAAFALALGIAIQNFPEGAIISMPLKADGKSKTKAFIGGVLSGAVEPIAGALTLILTRAVSAALPYLLAFAAGAMIYVVAEELIPDSRKHGRSCSATVGLMLGFIVMMILDVAFG
jgi:ZIP family zinc transporter